MKDFFHLISSSDFLALFDQFFPLAHETIPLEQALGRVLACDLISPENLPPFARSTMDGYAIRAADSFGCSDSEMALLTLVGEVAMGTSGQIFTLAPRQTVRIWTGGELPRKADAVVMVEYTKKFAADSIALFRPVAPGENVIQVGEDYQIGAAILQQGHLLRPQDLGVLAGVACTKVAVYRRPKVAILSTGDELVAPDQPLAPGKIRDMNSTSLAALVTQAGGIPLQYGICGDNQDRLSALCAQAIEEADVLLLSGGSSVGQWDCTLDVFQQLAATHILAHGVSIRPGKPTILARQGNKALFGLPGHAASALVVFHLLVRPLLRQYSGLGATSGLQHIQARTAEQIPSVIGREDYVRVRLTTSAEGLPLAKPVYGKSGLLNTLVCADGLLMIGRDVEGLDQGARAQVLLFPN